MSLQLPCDTSDPNPQVHSRHTYHAERMFTNYSGDHDRFLSSDQIVHLHENDIFRRTTKTSVDTGLYRDRWLTSDESVELDMIHEYLAQFRTTKRINFKPFFEIQLDTALHGVEEDAELAKLRLDLMEYWREKIYWCSFDSRIVAANRTRASKLGISFSELSNYDKKMALQAIKKERLELFKGLIIIGIGIFIFAFVLDSCGGLPSQSYQSCTPDHRGCW